MLEWTNSGYFPLSTPCCTQSLCCDETCAGPHRFTASWAALCSRWSTSTCRRGILSRMGPCDIVRCLVSISNERQEARPRPELPAESSSPNLRPSVIYLLRQHVHLFNRSSEQRRVAWDSPEFLCSKENLNPQISKALNVIGTNSKVYRHEKHTLSTKNLILLNTNIPK